MQSQAYRQYNLKHKKKTHIRDQKIQKNLNLNKILKIH